MMIARVTMTHGREVDLCPDHTARLYQKYALSRGTLPTLLLSEVERVEMLPPRRGGNAVCDECTARRPVPTEDFEQIVNWCREVLWPGGNRDNEYDADDLERAAAFLEPK